MCTIIVNSYEPDDALRLTPIDPGSVADVCRRADVPIWLDFQDIDDSENKKSELDAWLKNLGIDGLARRLLLEARDRPGVYPLKREICFVIPLLTETEGHDEVDYVGFLCRENLLLTLHSGLLLNRRRVKAFRNLESWLGERSIAALVSAFMINLSLACLQHTTVLRSAIVFLDEQLDRDADAVDASQLSELRSQVLALGMARRILERADRSIDELRSRLDMYAQDKTNRRLGMLTVLSAIFMPITLLAGIWE